MKTPFQIEKIKESAKLNTAVLDEVARQMYIGMSTAEIDDIVYTFTKEHGGIPAPLNYQGFPKVYARPSITKFVMAYRTETLYSKKEILLMWTYPQF